MADEFGQRSPKTNGYLNNIQVYDDDSPAVMDEPVVSYAASVPTVVSHSDPAMTPDAQNAFGLPGGYNNQALRLAHEETVSDQNAMSYLRQALNNSSEVTPTQGFAAALLAAIPTLGGYMIGKSVGNPDIPEGVYGLKPTMDSGAAGGLMGAQLGGTSASSFLAGIQQEGEKKREIYKKMADIESQNANRLDSQQAQIIVAGLGAKERRDEILDPVLSKAKLDQVRAEAQARAQAQASYGGGGGAPVALPPEMLVSLGLNPSIPHTYKEISTALALKKEGGINERTEQRMSGQAISPPSPKTKEAMTAALQAKSLGERYIGQLENIAKQNPSYLDRNIDKALPATELGNLQKNMELFAVQIRNARENGIMTEQDFERYNSYLSIGGLDTISSVLGRMKELQKVTDLSAQATLTAAKAGNENVANYEKLFGFSAPASLSSGSSSGEGIETKTLKDGTTVKVKRQSDGSYIEVQ